MPLIPPRGRPAQPFVFETVRTLELEDILRLASAERLPLVGVPSPKRLRAVHHRIAQLVAFGHDRGEIARICDVTPQRVTQLGEDPSFCELVAYFAEQMAESTIDAKQKLEERLVDISELATAEIQERLESSAEKIPISELRQIAQLGLDRTVAPPKQATATIPASMQVTFNMGPKSLAPREIEGTVTEVVSTPSAPIGAQPLERGALTPETEDVK